MEISEFKIVLDGGYIRRERDKDNKIGGLISMQRKNQLIPCMQ